MTVQEQWWPAVVATDAQGIVTAWNAQAEQLYGWPAQDAIGRPVLELTIQPDDELVAASIMARLSRGEAWQGSTEVRRQDGASVPAFVLALPLFTGDRAVSGLVAMAFSTAVPEAVPVEVAAAIRAAEAAGATIDTLSSHLEVALEAARLCTWEIDPRADAIDWDERHPAIVGHVFPGRTTFDEYLEVVYAEDRASLFEAVAAVLRDGGTHEQSYRIVLPDGQLRWVLSRGQVLPATGHMVGVLADVTSTQTTQEAVVRTLESMSDAFFALDRSWRFTYVNREGERVLRLPSSRLLGKSIWELFPGADGTEFGVEYRRAVDERRSVEFTAFYPPLQSWFEVRAHPSDDGLTVYFHDVTARREAEEEATRANARLRFLAEASLGLDASLQYGETLERVAQLVVPALGDTCLVDVYEPDGMASVAAAAVDPARRDRLVELRLRWPPDVRRVVPSQRVLQSGAVERFDRFPKEMWREIAQDDEHYEALLAVGLQRGVVVPLAARGNRVGAMSVGYLGDRPLVDADIALLEQLAARAGLAIDNARQYSSRVEVANTLQARLLPSTMPEIPGVAVAARYVAAGAVDVGGDFYDLFAVGEDEFIAVVGDVSGKGAGAASLTGLIRHTLRAVLRSGATTPEALDALNAALLEESDTEQFCTLVVMRLLIDSSTVRIRVASGGHPLPMLVSPDGTVAPVGRFGDVIGVDAEVFCPEVTEELMPGSMVVLYTDGVTERRAGARFLGEEGLVAVLSDLSEPGCDAAAGAVARAVTDFDVAPADDDMAVLVLCRLRDEA